MKKILFSFILFLAIGEMFAIPVDVSSAKQLINTYRDDVQVAAGTNENNNLDTALTMIEPYFNNEKSATPTRSQCLAPTNLMGVSTCGSCLLGATISWSAPEGPTPDSYVLYRTSESTGEVVTIDSISGSTTEYIELLEIGTFIYKLAARYTFEDGTCESDMALAANGEDFVRIVVASLPENNLISSLKLYPNPTTDIVWIEAVGLQDVAVYNIVGQCVAAILADDNMVSVALHDMQDGIYLFSIATDNGYVLKKVILRR